MAIFIPTMPESFNGSSGEEKAFMSLRLLSDKYIIFHSLSWIGIGERTQGEADFVIVHPDKGIMVIEVKAGEIEFKNGQWIQTNYITKEPKRIFPFNQAQRSQFEILDRINFSTRVKRAPLICHAVWFPSVLLNSSSCLPPEAPKTIVLDQQSLVEVRKAIDSVYDFWKNKTKINVVMDSYTLNSVIELLAPYFHAVPGLKGIIQDTEQIYIKLTNQQAALLDYLKEQKTAVIHGLAGTGKTVLAREKARMLANDGGTVLFLCYNSFLKEYLRKEYSQPGIVFHNVHSLAMEIMNYPETDLDGLLKEFEEYLTLLVEPEDWQYSHVVIDEGQDLDEKIINRLSELTKVKKGSFYVFYDKYQYIMKNEMPKWVEQAECKLVLSRNCRNTSEIFKTACSILELDSSLYQNSVHGEQPAIIFINSQVDLLNTAKQFVKNSLAVGIEPEEIVFLTTETEKTSLLSNVSSINGILLTSERAKNCLLFTTVRKFKGLEAKAVMIIDTSIMSLTNPEKRRLIYVGSSRAKHLLKITLIDDPDPKSLEDCIRRISPTRNVPKNKKGLSRILNTKMEA